MSVILSLLFIHQLIYWISGTKSNVLSCGLFGYCGSVAPDLNKIKILGLYNRTRGTHSCGILLDNVITKGVDKEKEIDVFFANNVLYAPENNFTVIGHTRQATGGTHSEINAHPFLVNNLVGAHNGVIRNNYELEKKYDFKNVNYSEIDSLRLYRVLEQVGYEVLSEYKGKAALLWTKLDEPNTLYVFHGASKEKKSDTNTWEERPMYYLEFEDGIYFSSMEESLNAIRDNEGQEVIELAHNEVWKVQNGKFVEKVYTANREEANIDTYSYENTHSSSNNYPHVNRSTNYNRNFHSVKNSKTEHIPKSSLILKENAPMRAVNSTYGNQIYFHKGRFHMPEGGLCQGPIHLNKKGCIVTELESKNEGDTMYFWKGVMLKGQNSYNIVNSLSQNKGVTFLNNPTSNFAYYLSEHSTHPITNYEDESLELTEGFRFCFYVNKRRAKDSDSFTPKFSGRNYIINKDGYLSAIKSSQKTDFPLTFSDEEIILINPKKEPLQLEFPNVTGLPKNQNENTQELSKPNDLQENLNKIRESIKNQSQETVMELINKADASCFSKEFNNVEDLRACIGKLGELALYEYYKDYYDEKFEVDPDNREISAMVNSLLVKCAYKNSSIIDEIEGASHRLINYYDMEVEKLTDEAPFDASVNHSAYVEEVKETFNIETSKVRDEVIIEDENLLSEAEELRYSEDEKAQDLGIEVIDTMEDLEETADHLQSLANSDFAQEFARQLYLTLTNFKYNFGEVLRKSNKENLIKELNSKISV